MEQRKLAQPVPSQTTRESPVLCHRQRKASRPGQREGCAGAKGCSVLCHHQLCHKGLQDASCTQLKTRRIPAACCIGAKGRRRSAALKFIPPGRGAMRLRAIPGHQPRLGVSWCRSSAPPLLLHRSIGCLPGICNSSSQPTSIPPETRGYMHKDGL